MEEYVVEIIGVSKATANRNARVETITVFVVTYEWNAKESLIERKGNAHKLKITV